MSHPPVQYAEFLGTRVALVGEADVCRHLSLKDAFEDLRDAFFALGQGRAQNRPRVRIDWHSPFAKKPGRAKPLAWLHSLRAGLADAALAGGKDYTSQGFQTPAMWVTVVDMHTGKPLAWVEADFLSRIRTASTTALATHLLAPADARCLAHFGAGKISEWLVRAILRIRPSIESVLLVRQDPTKGAPDWLAKLDVPAKLVERASEVAGADIVTTATNSRDPVLTSDCDLPRLRHLNLVGANHPKRREIDTALALRCLPPKGCLMVEDKDQAQREAGDIAGPELAGKLDWSQIETLDQWLAQAKQRPENRLTAFKSVGIGLADLAVAAGVLRRMGLLPENSD